MRLTILIPCLNEEATLGICIKKAMKYLKDHNIDGEVLIADNGSDDRSVEIARSLGARVIHVMRKGYGAALICGTRAARGEYIIMGDADDSYDFSNLDPFMSVIDSTDDFDLIMGNRFAGGIDAGAMPFLHKYLGTPVLSYIGRKLYNNRIWDYNCGMRCYKRDTFLKLDPRCPGMEYASEMIIKASIAGCNICEVPIPLHKDKRTRPPHLNTWSDGWRHLSLLVNCRVGFKLL